jgi:MFS transporter, DHA2 family, metal-tetracycline-proton antiporter
VVPSDGQARRCRAPPGRGYSPRRNAAINQRIVVPTFVLLVVVVVANNSAGSLAQPAIAEAFGGGPADVGWVVFGFGTSFAISTALWGGLAARFGLGRCLAIGVLLVALASGAAAAAPTLPALVAARIVQGIGAGAIPTLSTATVARLFTGADRQRALGTIVASVGLGLAIGPILGGLALEWFGWRGPMAFGIVAAPAALVVARIADPGNPAARLDVPGAILVAALVAAATFLLNRLPVLGISPPTIVAAAVLVATGALVAARSARPSAFLPRRIVGNPAFTRLVVVGALGMVAFLGTLVLVPIAAARAHGLDGIGLGLVILPLAVTGMIASRNSAWVQTAVGRRGTTMISLVSLAMAAAAVGLLGAATPPVVIALALLPVGVGFGLLQAPLVNELTVAFGDADRPLALGLYNLGFFLGGASGAAIATALVQSGVELPWFAGRIIPGYSTTELLLAIPPLAGMVILGGQMRRRPAEAATG